MCIFHCLAYPHKRVDTKIFSLNTSSGKYVIFQVHRSIMFTASLSVQGMDLGNVLL